MSNTIENTNTNTNTNELTMTSLEISELTGKRHDHVLRDIDNVFKELNKPLIIGDLQKMPSGQTAKVYNIEHRECDILLMGYSISLRAKVYDRWKELENQTQPVLPLTYRDALKELIIKDEQLELATLERDYAIRTKHHISNKKAATSMGRLSQAVQKINRLEIQLDESEDFATIKRVLMETGQKYAWRLLKKASMELGLPIKDVYDENYGSVKSYHRDAWNQVMTQEIH